MRNYHVDAGEKKNTLEETHIVRGVSSYTEGPRPSGTGPLSGTRSLIRRNDVSE